LCCFLFAYCHNIIDVGKDVSVHLIIKDGLRHSIEGGADILMALRNSEITVSVEGCNKDCFSSSSLWSQIDDNRRNSLAESLSHSL
jgi:hypothetical protein